MENWIRSLIDSVVGGVRALADAAWQRIIVVYNLIVTVGLGLRSAWARLLGSVRHKLTQLRSAFTQAYMTAYWIVAIRIPNAIGNAVDRVVDYIVRVVNDVENRVNAFVNRVIDWAGARIHELITFAEQLADWVRNRFLEVWHTLSTVAKRVFELLFDPGAIVEWLFGALIRKAINYFNENVETWVEWIFARSVQFTGKVAVRIEQMLERLL